MTAQMKTDDTASGPEEIAEVNQVRLRGRLSTDPEERTLPSGDTVWTFRVIVARSPSQGETPRARVDALECAAWSPRLRRSVARWREGDLVDVEGALRRRFYKAGGATVSRVEVEVGRGRLIRRARSG